MLSAFMIGVLNKSFDYIRLQINTEMTTRTAPPLRSAPPLPPVVMEFGITPLDVSLR